MNNPYQSPSAVDDETRFGPAWYRFFCMVYQPLWFLGICLAMAGLGNWVPTWVSYLGLGIWACTAVAAKFLPRLAGVTTKGWVLLTPEQIEEDDEVCKATIDELNFGYTLIYRGYAVHLYGENILACGAEAGKPDPSEAEVGDLLKNVDNALLELANYSNTFETALQSRQVHVVVVQSLDEDSDEICRSIDGRLIWQR